MIPHLTSVCRLRYPACLRKTGAIRICTSCLRNYLIKRQCFKVTRQTMEMTIAKTDKTGTTSGEQMHALMAELFPICRSITGKGVDQTLNILRKEIPLTIHKVPTKTRVFDWEVPKEWNIKGAYIANSRGEKIVDFADSNLHVLNYSVPIDQSVP